MSSRSARLSKQTYNRLKIHQREDETMADTLERIVQDEAVSPIDTVVRDVTSLPTDPEIADRINELAGSNASADDVVARLIDYYEEYYDYKQEYNKITGEIND